MKIKYRYINDYNFDNEINKKLDIYIINKNQKIVIIYNNKEVLESSESISDEDFEYIKYYLLFYYNYYIVRNSKINIKKKLESFKIPEIPDKTKFVKNIKEYIKLKEDMKTLEDDLNKKVYELYDLNTDEIKIIEDFVNDI